MALLVRLCITAFALGALMLCISCERHPVGQMPEVQREQVDPAKRQSEQGNSESEKPAISPAEASSSAHDGR